MDSITEATPADPGLEALVTLLQLQGVAADRQQIRHRLGTDKIGAAEIIRCARDMGLKARACRTGWSRLGPPPLAPPPPPAHGVFTVWARAGAERVLVRSPDRGRPVLITEAEFTGIWDGGLIL